MFSPCFHLVQFSLGKKGFPLFAKKISFHFFFLHFSVTMKVFFASFWNTSFLYHFVIILFSSSPFFFWIFLLLLWFLSSSVQFFFICSSLFFHFVLCVFLFSLVFIFRTHVFLDPVSIWFNMFFVFSFFLLSPFASPVSCFFSILDFVSSVWNLPIKTLSCPLLWKNICIFSCPISFIFSLSYFFITFCFHLVFSSPFQFDLFLLSPFSCCFFRFFLLSISLLTWFFTVSFKKTIFTLSFLITSFFLFFPFFSHSFLFSSSRFCQSLVSWSHSSLLTLAS